MLNRYEKERLKSSNKIILTKNQTFIYRKKTFIIKTKNIIINELLSISVDKNIIDSYLYPINRINK
tara:strand:+ start:5654 stop:5851 length:198 start_codon:yes stop_codon:yes gene_type:complete